MPTLRDFSYDSDDQETGQTISESAMDWVRHELGTFNDTMDDSSVHLESLLQGPNQTPTTCNKSSRPMHNESLSSSTSLSRTFTEDEILAQQQAMLKPHQNPIDNNENNDTTCTADTSLAHVHPEPASDISSVDISPTKLPRKMGRNEKHYNDKYSANVVEAVANFKIRHPNVLVNYHAMSQADKQAQQKRVMNLLDRLKIVQKENVARCKASNDNGTVLDRSDNSIIDHSQSINLLSPGLNDTHTTAGTNRDHSVNLLSSVSKSQDQSINLLATPHRNSQALFSPMKKENQERDDDSSVLDDDFHSLDSSEQSVEVARAAPNFESPPSVSPFSKKRAATSSGKKGADTSRVRFDASPSKGLVDSIGKLSIHDDKIFTSSQSPIPHQMTADSPIRDDSSLGDAESVNPNISFGDDYEQESVMKDSVVETAMLPDKTVRWDFDNKLTKEAPTHVKLLDGETMHYHSLKTAQRKPKLTQTFPDPLEFYNAREQRRLKKLYSWLLQRDKPTPGRALVLSVHLYHLIDLMLQLTLDYPRQIDKKDKQDGLLGNTLVVARTKEELERWSQAFRECSAASVFDHANLPLKDRKSIQGAKRASKYDVVLTTFDALKSPDVTVTLDGNGHIVFKDSKGGGWYTAQSQNDGEQNKQLSYLTLLNWRRVIFTDVIGRKSYLAKHGTARVAAAKALNSHSRYAFFVIEDEHKKCGVKALAKSDRWAMKSLSAVLRVPCDDEVSLQQDIIDFRDKAAYLARKQRMRHEEDDEEELS